jgi:hypothetical protein
LKEEKEGRRSQSTIESQERNGKKALANEDSMSNFFHQNEFMNLEGPVMIDDEVWGHKQESEINFFSL